MERARMTVPRIRERKNNGEPLAMITAYDAPSARIVDDAGVDIILVGDSVGTVIQGARTTLNVTLEEMEYHVRIVAGARPRAHVTGDLPFGTYQTGVHDAVASAVRLVRAGAESVKLEGGLRMADRVAAIVDADIPVMGHIGLTPQSYHRMGGNRIQGRTSGDHPGSRERLVADALALEAAGAFAIVIEGVPASLAAEITARLAVPTIGIGAGASCDGQVLVLHDVLGLSPQRLSFARPFVELHDIAVDAVRRYAADVRTGAWPDEGHSFT